MAKHKKAKKLTAKAKATIKRELAKAKKLAREVLGGHR